jgi:CHAT domain
MSKPLRILILAANPLNTPQLQLDTEHRLLLSKMNDNAEAGNCEILAAWATTPVALQRALRAHKPHIVHFAGHGNQNSIYLEDEQGMYLPLSKENLSLLFDLSLEHLRVVLLNACSSAAQTERLAKLVDYVVGTKAPIRDNAAVRFTAHFYQAIAVGSPVREAFNKAKGRLSESVGKEQADLYELLVRPGTDETVPLLPPFHEEVIRTTVGEVSGPVDVAGTIMEGAGALTAPVEPQPDGRRRVELNADVVKGKLRVAGTIKSDF